MSPALLLVVAAIYIWVAGEYVQSGRSGMAIAFMAYAFANFGFMLDIAWSKQ